MAEDVADVEDVSAGLREARLVLVCDDWANTVVLFTIRMTVEGLMRILVPFVVEQVVWRSLPHCRNGFPGIPNPPSPVHG